LDSDRHGSGRGKFQGGDLGTGEIVPLKYFSGGDGGAFIPPMLKKCHCKLSQ